MAAINFPASPTTGQVFTQNGRSWIWNGTSWVANNPVTTGTASQLLANSGNGTLVNVTVTGPLTYAAGVLGASGAIGPSGATGPTGPVSTVSGPVGATGATGPAGSGGGGLVFNVKDYGAVGNNSNDDTSAIQAAMAAASATTGGWNGGGIVYFPTGNYKITSQLLVNNTSIIFTGEGAGASVIWQWTASLNTIAFTNINNAQICGINNIGIRYASTPTGGAAVSINACRAINLTNFVIFSSFYGVLISNGSSNIFIQSFALYDYVNTGIYCVGPANDIYVNDFIMNTSGGSLGGIRLYDQVEAFTCSNGDILNGTWSMTTDATSYTIGNRPAYNVFSNMYFDSSANGVLLANCVEFDFVGCWFSGGRGNSQPGLTLSTSDSMRFTNTKFFNCGAEGVSIGSSAVRSNFTSCTFQSNSQSAHGVYAGIRFVTGTNDFQVLGCMGNNVVYNGFQTSALKIDSGCNNFIVANNNFRGTGGGISNAAGTSATQIVSQNLG